MSSSESKSSSESENEVSQKRKRSSPLSSSEKDLLLKLVEDHLNVVENKKTNGAFAVDKEKAWEKIAILFSSTPGLKKRTGMQLKKSWDNLKTRAKVQVSKSVKKKRKTGGGEGSRDREISGETLRVAALVPAQMMPLDNPYDCDAFDETDKTLEIPKEIEAALPKLIDPEKIKKNPVSKKPFKDSLTKLPKGQEIIIGFEEKEHLKRMELLDLQIKNEQEKMKQIELDNELKLQYLKHKRIE